jgi:molybdate transport system ATP-binding protein
VIEPRHVIELLGLGGLLRRLPDALSGGERQRVAIGRALLAQPRLLLMDEPLASLDVIRRDEILRYIELLRDDLHIPIVYVSHSVAEITRLADTVVLLSEGKALAVGGVDQVMGRIDLRPQTGRYEAGTVVDTLVAGHDEQYGLTTLHFAGGELLVPNVEALVGERVRVRIRARDVSLAVGRPAGLSIVNALEGQVLAIDESAGPTVEVQLRVGSVLLQARITRWSRAELGIVPGKRVFALVKAVSLDRRSVGYA